MDCYACRHVCAFVYSIWYKYRSKPAIRWSNEPLTPKVDTRSRKIGRLTPSLLIASGCDCSDYIYTRLNSVDLSIVIRLKQCFLRLQLFCLHSANILHDVTIQDKFYKFFACVCYRALEKRKTSPPQNYVLLLALLFTCVRIKASPVIRWGIVL